MIICLEQGANDLLIVQLMPLPATPLISCFGAYADEWSRPIFNLTSNYKNLSREEREQRDYEQLPKKRRIRFVYVFRLF